VIVYADTSALIKLVLREAGSEEMRSLQADLTLLASARIAYAELRAALAAANRDHRLPGRRMTQAKVQADVVWKATSPLEIDAELIAEAGDLAEAQALRGYDAVHLAALLRLGASNVVDLVACWDENLRRAARKFGYRLFPA